MGKSSDELKLKRDQIFGLHACVPDAEVDAICAGLDRALIEFARGWPGAERLAKPGGTTLLLFDELEDVKFALKEGPLRCESVVEELPPRYTGRLAPLLQFGQPPSSAHAPEGCAGWGFTGEDVPALIAMMSDPELHSASSESTAVWAPIHAIRALGWLRAESAVGPLAAEWCRLEAQDDDFLGDEIASALAFIGPASAAPAAAVLSDETRATHVRLCAARVLSRLATLQPEARAGCLAALVGQLAAHPVQPPDFNGLLVSALLDAHAVEAEPEIARAFASGRVDEMIAGDLEEVQIELGLKLHRERPPRPNRWSKLGTDLRAAVGMPDPEEASPFYPAAPFEPAVPVPHRAPPKVGRNEPCPCGSGKKYKKCCGA